jgi:hypothetical protein
MSTPGAAKVVRLMRREGSRLDRRAWDGDMHKGENAYNATDDLPVNSPFGNESSRANGTTEVKTKRIPSAASRLLTAVVTCSTWWVSGLIL